MADVAVASSVSNSSDSMASASAPLRTFEEEYKLCQYYLAGDLPVFVQLKANADRLARGEITVSEFKSPQDFTRACNLYGTILLLRGDDLESKESEAKSYYEGAAKLFEKGESTPLQNLATNKIVYLEDKGDDKPEASSRLDDAVALYKAYQAGFPALSPLIKKNIDKIIISEEIIAGQFKNPQDFEKTCTLYGTLALLEGDRLKRIGDKKAAEEYYKNAATLFGKARNKELQNFANNKIILLHPGESREGKFDRSITALQKFFSTLFRNFIVTLWNSVVTASWILVALTLVSLPFGPFSGPVALIKLITAAPTRLFAGGLLTLEATVVFAVLAIAAIAVLYSIFNDIVDTAARAYINGSAFTNAEDDINSDPNRAHDVSRTIIHDRSDSLKQEAIDKSQESYHQEIDAMDRGNNITGLLIHYATVVSGKPISVSNPDPDYVLMRIGEQINNIHDVSRLIRLRDGMNIHHDNKILKVLNAQIGQVQAENRIPRAQEHAVSADENVRLVHDEMGNAASGLDGSSGRRLTSRRSPEASSLPDNVGSSVPSAEFSSSLTEGAIRITNENQYSDVDVKAASTSDAHPHSTSLSAESSTSLHSEEDTSTSQEMELHNFSANTLNP